MQLHSSIFLPFLHLFVFATAAAFLLQASFVCLCSGFAALIHGVHMYVRVYLYTEGPNYSIVIVFFFFDVVTFVLHFDVVAIIDNKM